MRRFSLEFEMLFQMRLFKTLHLLKVCSFDALPREATWFGELDGLPPVFAAHSGEGGRNNSWWEGELNSEGLKTVDR
jgi:hypothetical protein